MEHIIYEAQINPDLGSDLEVNFIGLVETPAILKNFQAFSQHKAHFALNEEKRIISGPAMIADLPIYRNDAALGEYYVVFNKATIQNIVEKFSAKGYMQKFNLFHDQQIKDVTIFNSFIIDSSLGIKAPDSFGDLSDGSWFISAKVNNEDAWNKVKSGEIKGISVEGLFTYLPVAKVQMSAEQLARRIQKILNETVITD